MRAFERPSGFAWEGNNTIHVVYPGVDGRVHELGYNKSAGWYRTDLTQASGGPNLLRFFSAAYSDSGQAARQVPYLVTTFGLLRRNPVCREVQIKGQDIAKFQMRSFSSLTELSLESSLYPKRFVLGTYTPQGSIPLTQSIERADDVQAASLVAFHRPESPAHITLESSTALGYRLRANNVTTLVYSNSSSEPNYERQTLFKVVPALTGESHPMVSIESYAFPGRYLYDAGPSQMWSHIVMLGAIPSGDTGKQTSFRKAATFKAHGLLI